MKKCLFLLFLIALLFCTGCGKDENNYAAPVNFYYIHNEIPFGAESSVIVATKRESKGYENDYVYLVEQYLNGPTTYDCISPFPAGTMLEEMNWDQNRVQIVLSPHIATLSGPDLTVACACLTKTVTELTGISTVQIRTSNGLLNGSEVLSLTSDSFLYWDEAGPSDSVD